ncbi:hypothetical protein AB1L42_11000 [Thalassoglobus sp. JC818]|uniref:hypothetical protein n=1 Tax=Thalassoglobus sp. JC818 TaxID=3232136 RepID=UPI003458A12A
MAFRFGDWFQTFSHPSVFSVKLGDGFQIHLKSGGSGVVGESVIERGSPNRSGLRTIMN